MKINKKIPVLISALKHIIYLSNQPIKLIQIKPNPFIIIQLYWFRQTEY